MQNKLAPRATVFYNNKRFFFFFHLNWGKKPFIQKQRPRWEGTFDNKSFFLAETESRKNVAVF